MYIYVIDHEKHDGEVRSWKVEVHHIDFLNNVVKRADSGAKNQAFR